jgi:hypothetical protein
MGAPRRRVPDLPPHVEVTIAAPGSRPVSAVVPAASVADVIAALERSALEFPRLATGPGRGAVDIRLDGVDGSHVKTGRVILSRKGGRPTSVPIDPATRRFRIGDLPAGNYDVSAAAAKHGRAKTSITVREGDVVRRSVRLDGEAARGTTSVDFAVAGLASSQRVRVTATNRITGKKVYDKTVTVKKKGGVSLTAVPAGELHFEFIAGQDRSCYDVDITDLAAVAGPHHLAITPSWRLPVPTPDPPPWMALPEEFEGVARTLSRAGIGSMAELAAAQPEGLMHRLLDGAKLPVGTRLLCAAIEAARRQIGLDPTAGESAFRIRLDDRKSSNWTFRAAEAGTVNLDVDLGSGGKGRIEISGAGSARRVQISGRRQLSIAVSAKDIASGKPIRVTVLNQSGHPASGRFVARFPGTPGFGTIGERSIGDRIEAILGALALINPGLSTDLTRGILSKENIRHWLDRGNAIMRQLGVCSISDLGRLRIEPAQKLEPGAYIAPAAPPSPGSVVALTHYKLSSVIGGTVLHYRPNDILHQWAVVLANEWDLRGQVLFIGKEIRELYVIVGQLLHDAGTFILWEQPDLPNALDYWPEASNGGFVQSWGADGEPGQDGDPSPPRTKNGGPNAVLAAPTVTMYLLDSTNNLPPILLGGQKGATGGRGQRGGNGGNGFEGRPAESPFIGECCREAGFGGTGGAAGDGGKGGTGGRGGEGGRITVLTTAPGITVMETDPPFISCRSGRGGDGGWGGQPGVPGVGGAPGNTECEPHCDERPDRRGPDGLPGHHGPKGDQGADGIPMASDAIQILPITEQEWNEAFTNPHITHVLPSAAEGGDTVVLLGLNFDPLIDHVFFDGLDRGPLQGSAWFATFVVPGGHRGGLHPVVIRPVDPSTRLSNKVFVDVIPRLDPLPDLTRWEEGETVTVTGDGFMSGSKLIAEDWTTDPVTQFNLQLASTPTATVITATIPAGPLGSIRGVRRLRVRNPTGTISQREVVVRIGHEIIVRCAAFRLIGSGSGDEPPYSAGDISSLFVEGAFNALTQVWSQAGIVFRLVAPVKNVLVDDDIAYCFPHDRDAPMAENAAQTQALNAAPWVPGAINIFFVREVEDVIAFAEFGGGPAMIGSDGGDAFSPFHFMANVAHELGHALCVGHVCDVDGEFGLPVCTSAHTVNLMYPELITSSTFLSPSEIEVARRTATHFEQGKTASLPLSALDQPTTPGQCFVGDSEN